jgi:dTDP-4-amino-4,6-dideoxygalactose transaminase
MSDPAFIPFSRPSVTEAEVAAVERVIRSGWWTSGPEVKAFEEEFAAYIGVPHAVAVNSCTAGLHVAVDALGLSAGDLAFVPTMTFVATAEVVMYEGAVPVLLDVDPATANLDASQLAAVASALTAENRDAALAASGVAPGTLRCLRERLDARPALAIPVHYAGQACDMDAVASAAAVADLAIVEDSAHGTESWFAGRKTGTFGDAAAFSFYATKNLSTGEGGMVTTSSAELADRMRILTLHGISRDAWKRYTAEGDWYYEVVAQGYKYNLTDIAAALGRVQLTRLEEMSARRAVIAARYDEAFSAIEAVEVPFVDERAVHARHLYPIRLTGGLDIDRSAFIEELRAKGIGTSVHFIPLHLHPLYRDRYGYRDGDFPVAEKIFESSISLPIYPDMTDAEVERVCDAVRDVCKVHAA